MKKMLRRRWRRPVRLDRPVATIVFDLGILTRGFRKSLRVTRRFRWTVRDLRR